MRNSVGRAVGAAALLASLVGVATSGATVAAATSMLHTNLHAAHVFNDNVSSTNWGGYAV